MRKFGTKKAAVKKGNTHAAKGSQQEPINSESYAAVALRGHLATGPASSTHAASQETPEDYQGGRSNDNGVPSAAGESIPATLTIFLPHPLSCSCFNKSEET